MIRILYDLGRQVIGGQDVSLPYAPVKKPYTVFIFRSEPDGFRRITQEIQPREGLDVHPVVRKLAFVGNRKGNAPKDLLTVEGNGIRYLLFGGPWTLLAEVEKRSEEHPDMVRFATRLRRMIERVGFLELRDANGNTSRMLNLLRFLSQEELQRFWEGLREALLEIGISAGEDMNETSLPELASSAGKISEFEKRVANVFQRVVAGKLSSKEGVIWTLADEEGLLAEDPAYRAYVAETFRPSSHGGEEGHCRLCNRRTQVSSRTSELKFFKFYNTDKPGFAPHLREEAFTSLLGICDRCFTFILHGDRMVAERLSTSLAGKTVYLLPHPVPDRLDLQELAEVLRGRVDSLWTLKQWEVFQERFQKIVRWQETWDVLRETVRVDFVFATPSNAAVKVHRVIHDVPPSRLEELDQTRQTVEEWAESRFFLPGNWNFHLDAHYRLFPITKNAQVPLVFLDYLEALFQGYPLSWEDLTRFWVEGARIHHFGLEKAFKMRSGVSVERYMVETLVLRHFLALLGLLESVQSTPGGWEMSGLPSHLESFLQETGLTGRRAGLFLIGYVMGKIGEAQQQGVPLKERKSPPILNAITFTGMDDGKIRRLVNQVFDRMRHYLKGYDYEEGTRLLGLGQAWYEQGKDPLAPYEATYWVLAGYGFARLGKKERKNREEEA